MITGLKTSNSPWRWRPKIHDPVSRSGANTVEPVEISWCYREHKIFDPPGPNACDRFIKSVAWRADRLLGMNCWDLALSKARSHHDAPRSRNSLARSRRSALQVLR